MNIRADLQEILSTYTDVAGDETPLELDSLAVVQVVEAIEDRFAIRIAPRDVTPAHFATLESLVALVSARVT